MDTETTDTTEHLVILGSDRPASSGFDVVLRGYDKRQVDTALEQADADRRAAAELAQSARAQSAALQRELGALRQLRAVAAAEVAPIRKQTAEEAERVRRESVEAD